MKIKHIHIKLLAVLSVTALIISLLVMAGSIFFWKHNTSQETISGKQYFMDMSVKTTEGMKEVINMGENSKIWVNSSSTLKYAADYKVDRKIQLTGEAYFKIRKMDRPFTLYTDNFNVVLYGATFLLETYPDKEYVRIALYGGEAKVVVNNTSQEIILNPGTDLTLHKANGEMEMKRIKKGVFGPHWIINNYEYMAFNNILYSLSEYYEINVSNHRPELNMQPYTLTFEGDKTLEEVMFVLQTITKNFNYRIDSNELTIY